MSNNYRLFVITGASSGIGAEYARQLAAAGYDLVLVARRRSRLDALAQQIEADYSVSVAVHPADLTHPPDVERLAEFIRLQSHLYGLVNNAGFGTQGSYAEAPLAPQLQMLDVHVRATMILCRAALPRLEERGKGVIINVSSVAAFLPAAGNTTYSATKAFLSTFSRGLAVELRHTDIRVQAVCPGFTRTEFHDTDEYADFDRGRVPAPMWMTSQQVVRASLRALETEKVIVIPGLRYKLMIAMLRVPGLPRLARLARRALKMGR